MSSLDDDFKAELLNNIFSTGKTEVVKPEKTVYIANQERAKHLLNYSAGLPRFHSHNIKKFNLVINQIEELKHLNPFAIRCCLCGEVISYPAWHAVNKYAVNEIHYFVCLDRFDSKRVNAKCFKRS